jgi:hypothetical protein
MVRFSRLGIVVRFRGYGFMIGRGGGWGRSWYLGEWRCWRAMGLRIIWLGRR